MDAIVIQQFQIYFLFPVLINELFVSKLATGKQETTCAWTKYSRISAASLSYYPDFFLKDFFLKNSLFLTM